MAGYSLFDQSRKANRQPTGATGVYGIGDSIGVIGESAGVGVRGANTAGGPGVVGQSFANDSQTTKGNGNGIQGHSGGGFGVAGFSDSNVGVYGNSNSVGVSGEGPTGMLGLTSSGIGISGNANSGIGVKGIAGTGTAIAATNKSPHNPALMATNSGSGVGIAGKSDKGYGAELTGGRAPLRLVPLESTGHPKSGSHEMGELVIDKTGNMFVCIKKGRPGIWRKVSLT